MEVENEIEKEKVDLCRRRFEEQHLNHLRSNIFLRISFFCLKNRLRFFVYLVETENVPSSTVGKNEQSAAAQIKTDAVGKNVKVEMPKKNKKATDRKISCNDENVVKIIPTKVEKRRANAKETINDSSKGKKTKEKMKQKKSVTKQLANNKTKVEWKSASETDSTTSESVVAAKNSVNNSYASNENDLDEDFSSSADLVLLNLETFWDQLTRLFYFEMACTDCISAIEIRISERYVVSKSSEHDDCLLEIILVRPVNEKGNALMKIRRPALKIGNGVVTNANDFSICRKLKNNEDCKNDNCNEAHSPEGYSFIFKTLKV